MNIELLDYYGAVDVLNGFKKIKFTDAINNDNSDLTKGVTRHTTIKPLL